MVTFPLNVLHIRQLSYFLLRPNFFLKILIQIWDTFATYTPHTNNAVIIYKMIIHVNFNGNFEKKIPMLSIGFEPRTFRIKSSCLGVPFLQGFAFVGVITMSLYFGGHTVYSSHRKHIPELAYPIE